MLVISALLLALAPPAAWATSANEALPAAGRAEPEVFGVNTPLGRLSYQAGRGLRVGDTRLVLGGFATVEAERLEGSGSIGGLDGLNLFAFYDPLPFVHLFAEVQPLAKLGNGGSRSNPEVEVDRLYLDLGTSDALTMRFGRFLTPIGRWNVAAAEPLVWTTSEPLIVDEVFDETATGAMLYGSAFPRGEALSYSLYGTFLDQIAADSNPPPAEHSAGAHLEWASLGGWTLGASYFASETEDGEWNHLGGADLLWQPDARVEVSGEAVFGEGSRRDGALWGLYAQTAVETVPTLYVVGRYERFDPSAARAINLFDLGLAWVPRPYLRLKADYQFADHLDDIAEPGLRMSLSILF